MKPKPAEKIFPGRLYFYCGVKFPFSDHVFWYLTGDLDLEVGDRVEVPLGATDDPVTGEVVSVRTGTESDLPFSPKDAKHISRIVKTKNGGIYTSTGRVAHSVGDLNPKPKKDPEPEEEAKYVPPPCREKKTADRFYPVYCGSMHSDCDRRDSDGPEISEQPYSGSDAKAGSNGSAETDAKSVPDTEAGLYCRVIFIQVRSGQAADWRDDLEERGNLLSWRRRKNRRGQHIQIPAQPRH